MKYSSRQKRACADTAEVHEPIKAEPSSSRDNYILQMSLSLGLGEKIVTYRLLMRIWNLLE